jgi:hypothetical protein
LEIDHTKGMDEEPQRRKFQFSIRKLLLWMLAAGLFLGILRLLGVEGAGLTFAFCVVVLVAFVRAAFGAWRACVLFVLVVTTRNVINWFGGLTSWVSNKGLTMAVIAPATITFILCVLLGVAFGLVSYLFLEALFRSVDWADNLMRTKTTEKPS